MAVAMGACAVLLGTVIPVARFTVLLKQGRHDGLVPAFGRLRHRGPQDAKSGAQRDQLQHEGSGQEPGHREAR